MGGGSFPLARSFSENKKREVAVLVDMVGKLNIARTTVMGRMSRVVFCDWSIIRFLGDPRARWALNWRLQISPPVLPRAVEPIGGTPDVRTYSDASATDGGLATVARRRQNFVALLTGSPHDALSTSPAGTHEIYGPE